MAAELLRIARPLVVAGSDEDARRDLFDALGWDLENLTGFPITQFTSDVDDIVEGVVSLVASAPIEPKSFADISERLADIKKIFDGVGDLSQLAQSSSLNVPNDAKDALGRLGEDLVQLLLVNYLTRRWPGILHTARILTLIQTSGDDSTVAPALGPASGLQPLRRATRIPRVRLDRLGGLLSDPVQALRDEYLGANGLDTEEIARKTAGRLFDRFAGLFASLGAVVTDGSDSAGAAARDPGRTLEFRFGFPVSGTVTAVGAIVSLVSEAEGGAGIVIAPTGWVDASWATSGWLINLKASGSVPGFTLRRTGPVLPAGTESLSIQLSVQRRPIRGSAAVVIGSPKATRLELGSVLLGGTLGLADNRQDIDLELSLGKCAVVVQAGDGDGFLQKVLPKEGFRLDFDLAIGWSKQKGVYFRGSGGLEATLPLHIDVFGILKIDSVYLSLQSNGSATPPALDITVATSIQLKLGPIAASIEQMGLRAPVTFPPSGGNLGPANLALDFKPPKGAGLFIDASAVVGGGYLFFDYDKGQYGGVLQLEVKGGISIKAIGLITTKMPDGSPGFSLLVIIAVEFSPIQLGYGFTLNGVGGLAGFNRTMKTDALRDGVKNRTLDSIMFPPDPIANAQKIISDLQTVFPPAPGRFVFAPMVKLGWGSSILILEIGLVVELPSPLVLAIIGKVHLKLPPLKSGSDEESKAIVEMHLDVLGILDFDKGEATVDAVLYNSRIVVFTITGGMAMRLRWGSNPIFALAIGGFSPRFTPPPLFPKVDRLALQLSYDKSGLHALLRLESYLAVTANTLQFGARIDAYAEISAAKLAGFLGFDALIEFNPFHFIVDMYGGVAVRVFGMGFGVDLFLTLSGPRPFLGEGHVAVNFLGTHEFPIRFVIGDEDTTPALPPADPLPELLAALEDLRNWSAALPGGASMLVTVRQLKPEEALNKVLAHPLGELTVRQKVLPFGIALQRFGAFVPSTPGPFDVAQFQLGANAPAPPRPELTLRDAFARGQFVRMSEDEKLSGPGFESFRCGHRRIGTDAIVYSKAAKRSATFEYDVTIIDNKEEKRSRTSRNANDTIDTAPISISTFLRAAQFGAAKQTPMESTGSAKFAGPARGIKVREPAYVIADRDDLATRGANAFDTYTEAESARHEAGADTWQVIEAYEVA